MQGHGASARSTVTGVSTAAFPFDDVDDRAVLDGNNGS